MPRGDRTGPMGMGGMTGRHAGFCAGFSAPGFMNPVSGLGFRTGFGRGRGAGRRGFATGGRGRRNMFYATGYPGWMRFGEYPASSGYASALPKPDPKWEKQMLENQVEGLQAQLADIQKRLAEIETASVES